MSYLQRLRRLLEQRGGQLMFAKILITFGATILTCVFTMHAAGAALDAYASHGWAGLAITGVIVSAVPSLLLGILLSKG